MLHTDFSRPFLNAPDFLVVGDPMHFGAHNREKHLTSSLRRNLRTVGQSTHPGLSIGQRRFAMLALEGLLLVFTAMPQLLMVRGGLRSNVEIRGTLDMCFGMAGS
ncbi:hypothetical protein LB504_000996 [Fusarium proliferatum]|nr:hypothetical protein LB504_000996 [Fusarium proliferatum]